MPCIFPFEFKGIDHNQCIWDGDSENGAWCSTKVDSKGKHLSGYGNWGNCASECPFTPNPFKNTVVQTTTSVTTTRVTHSTTITPKQSVTYTTGRTFINIVLT